MPKPDDSAQPVPPHVPVLLAEVLEALAPLPDAHIVDGTFGAGGYSRALLDAGATVTAIDRDPSVRAFADALERRIPESLQLRSGRLCRAGSAREPARGRRRARYRRLVDAAR